MAWHAAVTQLLDTARKEQRWVPAEASDALVASRPEPRLLDRIRAAGTQPSLTPFQLEAVVFADTDLARLVTETDGAVMAAELSSRRGFFDTIEKAPLTDEQARAVVCFDNRVQVLAAAGSGKTSVMVARAAYAVCRGFVPAERILLLAFNRSAAAELQERVDARFAAAGIDSSGVGTDVAQAFACMAAMRTSLRKLLDEIRAEFNRLHTTIHDSAVLDAGVLQVNKIPNYVGALDFGKYMGTTMFLDEKVSVWETKQGTIVLPALETVGVDVVAGSKLKGSALVSRYLAERPDVRQRFPQAVRLEEFVRVLGDEDLADGRIVRDVLKVLPAGADFRSIDDMVAEIGEREAVIVRTTMGAPAAVSAALGIDTAIQTVADADVAKLGAIPTKAREALARGGINSVGELAKASPDRVLSIMRDNQINVGVGDVAEWTTYAQTPTKLR